MKQTYNQTAWPAGWCLWQTEQQIEERHPGINCIGGGLWLPIGLTVNIRNYIKSYAHLLRSMDIEIHTGLKAEFHYQDTHWKISTYKTDFKSNNLIFATGYNTVDHPYWKFLPLEGVKGQVAIYKAKKQLLNFEHSISSMGYIARFRKSNRFIQGSTYEHDFTNLQTNIDGEEYLRSRTKKVLPSLAENAELVKQWAGVRVNTPDRKPVLGEHPEMKNLYVFTGLGSKGLMYGKFLANHFADHLSSQSPLFLKFQSGVLIISK